MFDSWEDELYHYGIIGQKWGIRRYQNPDGTLTQEGRDRYKKKGLYFEVKNASKNAKKGHVSTHTSEALKAHPKLVEAAKKLQSYTNQQRQAFEEYTDTVHKEWNKTNDIFKKTHKRPLESEKELAENNSRVRNADNLYSTLMDREMAESKRIAKKLLGRYGNKKIFSGYNGGYRGKYSEKMYDKAQDVVAAVLRDITFDSYSKTRPENNIGMLTRLFYL